MPQNLELYRKRQAEWLVMPLNVITLYGELIHLKRQNIPKVIAVKTKLRWFVPILLCILQYHYNIMTIIFYFIAEYNASK